MVKHQASETVFATQQKGVSFSRNKTGGFFFFPKKTQGAVHQQLPSVAPPQWLPPRSSPSLSRDHWRRPGPVTEIGCGLGIAMTCPPREGPALGPERVQPQEFSQEQKPGGQRYKQQKPWHDEKLTWPLFRKIKDRGTTNWTQCLWGMLKIKSNNGRRDENSSDQHVILKNLTKHFPVECSLTQFPLPHRIHALLASQMSKLSTLAYQKPKFEVTALHLASRICANPSWTKVPDTPQDLIFF